MTKEERVLMAINITKAFIEDYYGEIPYHTTEVEHKALQDAYWNLVDAQLEIYEETENKDNG